MEYKLKLPVDNSKVGKLNIGDIIYITGKIFTARDEAHNMMLEIGKKNIPFDISNMALFHCGPLMKKTGKTWEVISAGPTTSSRMEIFEDKFSLKVPYYFLRHSVKPGLTGWAQVKHDEPRSDEGPVERLQYDLFYIQKASLFLDFLIFLKTLQTVLFKFGQ